MGRHREGRHREGRRLGALRLMGRVVVRRPGSVVRLEVVPAALRREDRAAGARVGSRQ